MQLIAAMLGHIEATRLVEVEALGIANAAGIAFLRRELLIGLIGSVPPDAGTRLELGARVVALGMRHAILDLAGIGGRAHGHEEIAVGIDENGCIGWSPSIGKPLRMVSLADRNGFTRLERIPHDPIVDLGVEPVLAECDAGAARDCLRPRLRQTLIPRSARPVPLVSLSATRKPPAGGLSLP